MTMSLQPRHTNSGFRNHQYRRCHDGVGIRSAVMILLLAVTVPCCQSFAIPFRGGGRAPQQKDTIEVAEDWEATPCDESECRLIICHITDVYTLEHLAHYKTLVDETKKNSPRSTVVTMLTGDFLSPYLLSSIDQGEGMMQALADIDLDYLTWGNHEADIRHSAVCRHVREFPGKWLNSNMLDHEAMDAQQEYDVITLSSPDGSQTRKIGLTAVLSNDPNLYKQFKAPGAFGGATIDDPWETLAKYKKKLTEDEGCDLIVPLQHLYVPDDHKTCREFDFPVILSGHDHHRVDEVVEGSRLIKPGMNAEFAAIVEISYPNKDAEKATIRSRFVRCQDWEADPETAEKNERAYDSLIPLRNTELARVPASFAPLSSNNSRGSVCTMGKYICTLIRSSLNVERRQRALTADAVVLMGGNIRGNADYEDASFFSLEALEAEIKSEEIIAVVEMPGWLLAKGIQETHSGDPIPGWMQYDTGIDEDNSVFPPVVTHVAYQPIDPDRIYRVGTKIGDLTNTQSPAWTEYFTAHPETLPAKGAYVNIQSELMSYFARNLWRRLWDAISEVLVEEQGLDETEIDAAQRLSVLDTNGDGFITVPEIQRGLDKILGHNVDGRETTLAKFVHDYGDTTNSGRIDIEDFEIFCKEMLDTHARDNWRLSSPKRPAAATNAAKK